MHRVIPSKDMYMGVSRIMFMFENLNVDVM